MLRHMAEMMRRVTTVLLAAGPATAPCASYAYKQDWNVHDPVASTRCIGRFLTIVGAEAACTATPECEAVCIDNGMPCKCEGNAVCEDGLGSLPLYEMRKGAQATWVEFGSYIKQPSVCWGVSFLTTFIVALAVYAGGGVAFGRRQGRRPVPGVPALLGAHPHVDLWLSVWPDWWVMVRR